MDDVIVQGREDAFPHDEQSPSSASTQREAAQDSKTVGCGLGVQHLPHQDLRGQALANKCREAFLALGAGARMGHRYVGRKVSRLHRPGQQPPSQLPPALVNIAHRDEDPAAPAVLSEDLAESQSEPRHHAKPLSPLKQQILTRSLLGVDNSHMGRCHRGHDRIPGPPPALHLLRRLPAQHHAQMPSCRPAHSCIHHAEDTIGRMVPVLSSPNRLLAATLIDWIGTGFYLAISAIFLTRSAGLKPNEVGLILAVAGMVAFFGSVHVGRLGDRVGPRQVLLVLYVMRAAAFVGLTIVHNLGVTLVMLSVIALCDQAASSMYQALANVMASKDERVGLMARMRVAINIGITLGTVPAGIALATQGNSFTPLLLGNAASYLLAGLIVATLPVGASPEVPPAPRRLLIPSPATAAMIGINGLMSLWVVILNVGLPLWIVDATTAPRALVAVLYGTSTVVAILMQARVARLVSSYWRAAQAQRLAGILLALCCGCLGGSALVGGAASAVLLITGVLCLSGGELLTVSSAWEVSFRLAPPGRSAEFFATYGLGRAGSQVAGPILITVAVLGLGVPGWLALAGLFIIGGFITPLMAQRAYDHPLVYRKPPSVLRRPGCRTDWVAG